MQVTTNARRFGFMLAALALWGAGCSHTRVNDFTRIATPLPPPFLTGPAAIFFTNTIGFSAQVESQSGAATADEGPPRGQLLGAGPKLLFAPVRDKAAEKRSRAGNFLFIWDVSSGRGYVLSEALQAYAPISSDLRATNVIGHATAGPGRVSDLVTLQMNNGLASTFQVLWSAEAKGLPMRINSITNPIPLTVSLSKARLESVAADLFTPPEDFTKYDSPEALVDELAARQRNLRRKQPSDMELENMMRQPQR